MKNKKNFGFGTQTRKSLISTQLLNGEQLIFLYTIRDCYDPDLSHVYQ